MPKKKLSKAAKKRIQSAVEREIKASSASSRVVPRMLKISSEFHEWLKIVGSGVIEDRFRQDPEFLEWLESRTPPCRCGAGCSAGQGCRWEG